VANQKTHKAPAQFAAQGFSQRAHVPTVYPLFPRQFQFSSNWNRTIEVDLQAGQFQWGIGLFDYLTYIPEYALEMYSLYKYSRIVGVTVRLTVVGESDESNQNFAYEAAMAKVPFNQIGLSPTALKLVRGSRYSLSPTSGMNKTILTEHFGSFDELGNPVYDRSHWQSLADATTATPTDTDRPVVGIAVRVVNGNRGIVSINVSATYHMQFFELEYTRIPELELVRSGYINKDREDRVCNIPTGAQTPRPVGSRAQKDKPDFVEIADVAAPRRR